MTLPLSKARGLPIFAGYQTGTDTRGRAVYRMFALDAVVAPKSTGTVRGDDTAGWIDTDYVQIHAMDQVKRNWASFKWFPFPLVDPKAWMAGRAYVENVMPDRATFGPVYVVLGSPQVWVSPFTGQVMGTVIQAKNEEVGSV